jgi:hypothetical protein
MILGAALAAAIAVTVINAAGSRHAGQAPRRGTPTPVPAVLPGPLNGLLTARAIAMRRPIAAIIDNEEPNARPQSGLAAASLVFEAPTEGGITRLMALYLEKDAPVLGPIRSARTYFISWAAGYRALFVHAGGAPNALRMLYRTPELANVEALLPSRSFYRVADRPEPDNLYSGTEAVRSIAQHNGWDGPVQFGALPHTSQEAGGSQGKVSALSFDFSTRANPSPAGYSVSYQFDSTNGTYARSVGGAPAIDKETGQQIAVNNVVALLTSMTPIRGDKAGRIRIVTVGRGRALFFMDGQVMQGTWSKPALLGPLTFRDERGRLVQFKPGTTWIEVVPPGGARYRSAQ